MRLLGAIGSWWTTAGLLLVPVVVHLHFVSGENVYQRWEHAMLHTPAGLMCLALLAANLLAASALVVAERFRRASPDEAAVRSMDAHADVDRESGRLLLDRAGFPSSLAESGGCSRKGRFSFLPGTILRLGLVVLLMAVPASTHLRTSEEAVLHPDEEKVLLGVPVLLESISAPLSGNFLKVGEQATFTLEDVAANMAIAGSSVRVDAGYPTAAAFGHLRLTHVGYHQDLTVAEHGLSADLDVLPPGRAHGVPLPGGGTLTIKLEPERTVKKGLITGEVYNLKEPRYRLSLRERGATSQATLHPGDSGLVGDVPVVLGPRSLYVRVLGVSDPALPFLYAGCAFTLIGLVLMLTRFFWYERRLCVRVDTGRVLVGYEEEFYRRWGIYRFRRWTEGLPSDADT